ncbi:MAG: lytic murein transglycosylase [bacterium]|nr:lytic murein transglycosylase [bacterium]
MNCSRPDPFSPMTNGFIPPKPRVLKDIRRRGESVFSPLPSRVNLHYERTLRVPLFRIVKTGVVLAAVISLIFGSVSAPLNHAAQGAEPQQEEERKALEAQLAELEGQIAQYEKTILSYKKQGSTLKSEIGRLNAQVAKLNLQIKAVALSLTRLNEEISATQSKIGVTEENIDQNKEAIGKLLQDLYEREETGLIEVMLANPKLSDFFGTLNNLLLVQDSLRVALGKIVILRNELLDQKDTLSIQRADVQSLRAYQDAQRQAIQKTVSNKDNLLQVTKGQEARYQAILKETQKTASEIRNRIFRLLGGGELPFGEAVKFAQFAERATGVRSALILAVLTQESAIDGVIGKNLGRCYYDTVWINPEGRVMRAREAAAFEETMKELGLNPKTTPVSCPINRDGYYGGAMGPAQFMPTTWKIYEDRVGAITGGSPASPFNNADAFTATALYLKDAGAANATLAEERIAAARYYAGGNYRRHIWGYGDSVVRRAESFQDDIDVLDANVSGR